MNLVVQHASRNVLADGLKRRLWIIEFMSELWALEENVVRVVTAHTVGDRRLTSQH